MSIVASNYAQGFRSYLQDEEELRSALLVLNKIREFIRNQKGLGFFLQARFIAQERKEKLIELIAEEIEIPLSLRNFLVALIKRGRFGLLDDIISELEESIREERKLAVRFESCYELGKNFRLEVQSWLSERLQQSVEIEFVVNRELLFGFKIYFDCKVIDLSLEEIFRQLKGGIVRSYARAN